MIDLLDLKIEGFDELNIEIDKVSEEKDDDSDVENQQLIGKEVSDMLSRVMLTKLETISIEVDKSLGFLCNPSWSANIIIIESLLAEMERRRVLYFQTPRESLFNWKKTVCYTFERAFRSKIETLITSSKMNIRQNNMDKSRYSVRDSLYRIVNGGATSTDFLLFLLNGFSNISFTNIALGNLIEIERFLECLRNY
jgi:acid stress-induced BolA-like protein IbaG/YrbA